VELRGSILIAASDPAVRGGLTRVLGGEGYLPYETASRSEALALVRDLSVDLAILDAFFPDGSGLDACERLRGLVRGVRVIFMTCDPSREFRRDALSVGAYSVIPKPVRPKLVLATVDAALGYGNRINWQS